MRDIKVVYVPPVCTEKVVRGGELRTFEELVDRLLDCHVPGVTRQSYLELMYPDEGKLPLIRQAPQFRCICPCQTLSSWLYIDIYAPSSSSTLSTNAQDS